MKSILPKLIVLLVFISSGITHAQTTVVLQPDFCLGKDAVIASCVPCGYDTSNFGSANEFSAIAWTAGGNLSNFRTLMQFDLSRIPATATITNATLSLYHNTIAGSGGNPSGHTQITGSNEAWLQRITSPWAEYGVTWNSQPTTTTQNEVTISASTSASEDYPNIDVTALVQDMVSNPSQNFGFMIRLQTEINYRGLVFASSDHPDTASHPKLMITYLDTATIVCISSQPDSSICNDGKDAVIASCVPCGYDTSNFGSANEFSAIAWTAGGNLSNFRTLMQFESLNNIPPNAIITSATLSLVHNTIAGSGGSPSGHTQITGSNEAWLQRITSPWAEYGVTWNSQPTTTTQNEVTISASTSASEDYPNIDVTALVQDMVSDPSQSFGFMIRLQTEINYRGLVFASSDHPDPASHPKLDVCYTIATGLNNLAYENIFTISPNPITSSATIQINEQIKNAELVIYDMLGKKLLSQKVTDNRTEIKKGNLSNGIYFIRIKNNGKEFVQKIAVQ